MNDSYAKDKNNIYVKVPHACFNSFFVEACCLSSPCRSWIYCPFPGRGVRWGTAFPLQSTTEKGRLNAPLTFGNHGHILTYRSFSKQNEGRMFACRREINLYSLEWERGDHPSHTPRIKTNRGGR